jgi:hypothetical protein
MKDIRKGQIWLTRRPWGDDNITLVLGEPFEIQEQYLVETYTLFLNGEIHQCRMMLSNFIERLDDDER